MKRLSKRALSLLLTLLMLVSMIPVFSIPATAATTKDFSASTVADLGISATDAKNNGTCEWRANGNTINGSLEGAKMSSWGTQSYEKSSTTLTLTNKKEAEAQLSFKYSVNAIDGKITVNGTEYSNSVSDKSVIVTLGTNEVVEIKLEVSKRSQFSLTGAYPDPNSASINIYDISLTGHSSVDVTFGSSDNGGTYTVTNGNNETIEVPRTISCQSTDLFTLKATPEEGYSFAGWYNVSTDEYLSASPVYTTIFAKNTEIKAKFIPTVDGIYGVGETRFNDLTDAAQAAANSSNKTVILLKDATLEGNHNIPAGVTLLIPYDAGHTLNTSDPDSVTNTYSETNKWTKPSKFRTLTMLEGSSITVNGSISVNAKHESCVGGAIYGGQVCGKYGEIKMETGSSITLNNGANLYAWGYIWGSGTVEALSGATVYEKMQVTDYRGGTNTSTIAFRNMSSSGDGAFPFNQYYIQNVEVKEILHAGASLMAHAAVNLSSETPAEAAVEFIGSSSAMFSVSNGTLTKEYNPDDDRLLLSVDGDENTNCMINGMSLSMGILSINSENYVLPINSNIDISINAGVAVVNQRLVLQPGVSVYVDSDAMLATNANVYVIDYDQWGNFVFNNKRQQAVAYTPSLNGTSSRTVNSDAEIDVNGQIVLVNGVFTTNGGAKIISSEETGKIIFSTDAPSDSTVYQLTGGSDKYAIPVTSAQLTNGNAAKPFTETKVAAEGDVFFYCAECDTWHREADGCFVSDHQITWVINGKSEISECKNNTVPVYPGTTAPAKAPDANAHYTFAGWATTENGTVLDPLPAATANVTYYAVFTSEAHDIKEVVDGKHYCSGCDYTGNFGSCSDLKDNDHKCDVGGEDIDCHQGTVTLQSGQSATCGADGYEAYYKCSCEKLYSDDQAQTPISDLDAWKTGNSKIPATGNHADNNNDHNCDVCGTELSKCADNDKNHNCDVCGDKLSDCVDNDKDHNCDVCGTELSKCADNNNDHNCDVCGEELTTCADDDKDHNCDICGTELSKCADNNNDHNCDVCGAVNVTDHTEGAVVVENEVAADCVNNGSYDNVVYCTVCGEELSRVTVPVDALGHSYNAVVTDPTCTENGYTTYTCNCGHSYTDNTVAALGHKYNDHGLCDNSESCPALSGWNCIGEAWYYFYGDGKRAEGITRVPYPTVAINGITYAPNPDDIAYAESKGQTFIDAESALFVFTEKGMFAYDENGHCADGAVTRYAVDGMIPWHYGLTDIPSTSVDGEDYIDYYYFLGDTVNGGNIMATGDVYVTRANGYDGFVEGGLYTFDETGALVKNNGIVENADGKLRYYENYRVMLANGLTKVGDKYIYVNRKGELIVGTHYYVPENDLGIVSKTYNFDENGYMIDPVLVTKNGVVKEDGVLKYYEDGRLAYAKGWVTTQDGKIYVRSNGQLAVGEYYVGNEKHTFDENGILQAKKNGIFDGYYYVDGNVAYNAGVVEIEDGKYIYVRSNGQLATGSYWITNVGDSGLVAKKYDFDANGVMQDPELVADQKNGVVDGYYYVDGQIMYGAGLVELEDGRYIYVRSNGQLATGIYWATNHNDLLPEGSYDFGTDGYMVSTERV